MMVLTANDLKHIELMDRLADKKAEPVKPSRKEVLASVKILSFDEKILKLCAQLQNAGFGGYASNIEQKFLLSKQADTHLYRAHDEDGEDLVEFAHPDGNHNVGDGELGDVETIVSRHNKIKQIVKKQPTGKLAAYVDMCKTIIAQVHFSDEERLRRDHMWVRRQIENVDNIISQKGDLHWYGSLIPYKTTMSVLKSCVDVATSELSPDKVEDAINSITNLVSVIKGNQAVFMGALNPYSGVNSSIASSIINTLDEVKEVLVSMREIIINQVNKALPNQQFSEQEASNSVPLAPSDAEAKINQLLARLEELQAKWNTFAASQPKSNQEAANKWFAEEKEEIMKIQSQQDFDSAVSNINAFKLPQS